MSPRFVGHLSKSVDPVTYDIPGGLCGNPPGTFADNREGNVLVETAQLDAALRWILRRGTVLRVVDRPESGETVIAYNYGRRK